MRTADTLITVKQGADMAVHIVWSDDNGNPIPVNIPARAEVRAGDGTLIAEFDDSAPAASQPSISASESSGIIQLTAPRSITSGWPPGTYDVDVFVTVTGGADPFASGQYRPALSGKFAISRAITTGAP